MYLRFRFFFFFWFWFFIFFHFFFCIPSLLTNQRSSMSIPQGPFSLSFIMNPSGPLLPSVASLLCPQISSVLPSVASTSTTNPPTSDRRLIMTAENFGSMASRITCAPKEGRAALVDEYLRKHTYNKALPVIFKGHTFRQQRDAKRYLENLHGSWPCGDCGKVYINRSVLADHFCRIRPTPLSVSCPHQCHACSTRVPSSEWIALHPRGDPLADSFSEKFWVLWAGMMRDRPMRPLATSETSLMGICTKCAGAINSYEKQLKVVDNIFSAFC